MTPATDGVSIDELDGLDGLPAVEGTRRAALAISRAISEAVDRRSECVLALGGGRSPAERGTHVHTSFTFLGYTFRTRSARSKHGRMFAAFLPAVSRAALVAM
ncbi:MAG: hypothetical protein ACR2KL_12195, partial [Nocardioidaceae bacterium]